MLKNKRKKRKNIEPICRNCLLYDSGEKRCKVTILHEGERYELETDPDQHCLYDQKYLSFQRDPRTGKQVKTMFKPQVQEARFWVEDPKTHEPTQGDGVVKIRYPDGFFGDDTGMDYLDEG